MTPLEEEAESVKQVRKVTSFVRSHWLPIYSEIVRTDPLRQGKYLAAYADTPKSFKIMTHRKFDGLMRSVEQEIKDPSQRKSIYIHPKRITSEDIVCPI